MITPEGILPKGSSSKKFTLEDLKNGNVSQERRKEMIQNTRLLIDTVKDRTGVQMAKSNVEKIIAELEVVDTFKRAESEGEGPIYLKFIDYYNEIKHCNELKKSNTEHVKFIIDLRLLAHENKRKQIENKIDFLKKEMGE